MPRCLISLAVLVCGANAGGYGSANPAAIAAAAGPVDFQESAARAAASSVVAQEAQPPAEIPRPDSGEAPSQDRVGVDQAGRLEVRFRNVDLAVALEMLSEQTGRNIVLQNGVTGTVSTILRRVTFDEALRAILTANNLTYQERDNVIYVMPIPKKETAENVPTELRVYKLRYISASDAELALKPLLDEATCTLTRTKEPERGIKSDKEAAGGFNAAGDEMLILNAPPEVHQAVAAVLGEMDTRPQQVLVEATIMRATLNDQNALGIDFNFLGGVDLQLMRATAPGATQVTSLGNVPQSRLDDTSYTLRTDFNALAPAGGFTFGILKEHVAAFVRALEQVTDVSVIANPKIVTLNKQRGEIIVGRRDGYLTTTVTETAAVQTVEFLETGTKLVFRPFILGDGDIRVEIHPEDSNGGLTAANLPFQETTEATTNIIIRDGHTILIGGLFRERTNASKSRVPLVSNIPWLGKLFEIQQDSTTREEVIILLTIHVLKDSPAEQAAYEELNEDIERIRVAMRRGLMGTGRERLAEAHYHWALEHLRQGELEKALKDVRQAIHIYPRYLDAIKLEEQLVGRRTWDAEGSRMRGFVEELLRAEAGLPPRPVHGKPDVREILDTAGLPEGQKAEEESEAREVDHD